MAFPFSVTRFVEISLLRLFCIKQNLEPTFANILYTNGQFFIALNVQLLKKIKYPSGRTVLIPQ